MHHHDDALRPGSLARDAERGITLVELMIAAVLLVVGLLGIMMTPVRLEKLRRADAELGLALATCRNNLERVRSLPIGDVPALDGVGFDVAGPSGAPGGLTPLPGDADGLPGVWQVTVDTSNPDRTLYAVRTIVTWVGASGPREFALDTLVGARS